jgi:hypothetical protein
MNNLILKGNMERQDQNLDNLSKSSGDQNSDRDNEVNEQSKH